MPAITATAPGKIILFGEHAVVYGQPAIAVPVNQVKARAIISPGIGQPRGSIYLQAPDIDLEDNLEDIPQDHPLVIVIKEVLQETGIDQPPAMIIRITSTIPVAAGLGSGAAVSVAIIRALSEYLGVLLSDERVSNLAFEVEKIHHGTPSGIDNSVITYQQPIYFSRGDVPRSPQMEIMRVKKPFTLVIGDSGIPSPTAKTVGDVRKAWQGNKTAYQGLFQQIGRIAENARTAINTGNNDLLGPLMNANQELLEKMGVSSPELARLIHAALEAGAQGAKLSGGGRGGNMIALASPEIAQQIASSLSEAGAVRTIITEVE